LIHVKYWNFQGKQLKQLKQINIGIWERKSKTTFEKSFDGEQLEQGEQLSKGKLQLIFFLYHSRDIQMH
jgi:hypothetical protein